MSERGGTRRRYKGLVSLLLGIAVFGSSAPVQGVSKYLLEKLVTDLNESRETNREARTALVELGEEAVPRLLQEVEKHKGLPSHSTSDIVAERLMAATRALRVLVGIGSRAALPIIADSIVNEPEPVDDLRFGQRTPAERWRMALRNEAIRYLYLHFDGKDVRDLFVAATMRGIKLYRRKQFSVFRWRTCKMRYEDHLHIGVDYFTGLRLLRENGDDRLEDIIALMIETMPYEICDGAGSEHGVGSVLSEDGFDTARFDLLKCGMDSSYRMRIYLMRMAGEIGAAKAVSAIEPLLKSEYEDEREVALEIISKLTGDRVAITLDEWPDRLVLGSGESFSGKLMSPSINMRTAYAGSVRFDPALVRRVRLRHPSYKRDVIETHDGDRVLGVVMDDTFAFERADGRRAKVPAKDVESIVLQKRPSGPSPP